MTHQPRPTLSFSFESRGAKLPPRTEQSPFVIALMGDFSGRSSRGIVQTVSDQVPVGIDIDNFNQAMARFSPQLALPDSDFAGGVLELSFSEIEDFHPDRIAPRLPGLQQLKALRTRLLNASTSTAATVELQALLGRPDTRTASGTETDGEALTRLLGRSSSPAAEQSTAAKSSTSSAQQAVEKLAQQAVAGSVVAQPSLSQTELLAALDRACAEKLNAVLHDSRFQALESAWRSVDRLVRTFDDGDHVKLMLLDVSLEELSADFGANEDVTASGLYRLFYDATSPQAWAAICALYTFGETSADLAIAGKLARAGAYLATPVIAAAHPTLVGSRGFGSDADSDKWTRVNESDHETGLAELRSQPEAAYLGLLLPRFVLRQPYGKNSDPIQAFAFEEITSTTDHESYLWSNPSILVAELLIERFKNDGWSLSVDQGANVSNIPLHRYRSDGESQVKPGAEAWLSERAAASILQRGLIPLLSIKNSDSVRIVALTSVANPPQPLALRLG